MTRSRKDRRRYHFFRRYPSRFRHKLHKSRGPRTKACGGGPSLIQRPTSYNTPIHRSSTHLPPSSKTHPQNKTTLRRPLRWPTQIQSTSLNPIPLNLPPSKPSTQLSTKSKTSSTNHAQNGMPMNLKCIPAVMDIMIMISSNRSISTKISFKLEQLSPRTSPFPPPQYHSPIRSSLEILFIGSVGSAHCCCARKRDRRGAPWAALHRRA